MSLLGLMLALTGAIASLICRLEYWGVARILEEQFDLFLKTRLA